MKRLVLGALAATVAMIVWGMLFWAVLYEPLEVFGTLPESEKVAAALKESGAGTGTYFYPWPRNTPETAEVWLRKHTEGPFFKLSYVREGVNPQAPIKFLFGLLHYFVVSLIAGWLLLLALPALGSFGKRVLLVFLAGSIGTVFIQIGDPVWFHMPWGYTRGVLVFEFGSWLILGAVLGGILKD